MKATIDLDARAPVVPMLSDFGIGVQESRHSRNFSMPLTRYDFSEVMLVLDGEGWLVHNGVSHSVTRKQVIIMPHHTLYRFEDSRCLPLSILGICIKPTPSVASVLGGILPETFSIIRRSSVCSEVATILRTILREQSLPGPYSGQVTLAQTLLLLARLRRDDGESDPPAHPTQDLSSRVRDYITSLQHGSHQQETLEMVASRLKLSPKTLTRHFRAIAGKSRRRYIEELRLKEACRRLIETDQSVTSIAFGCGFEDLSTFFRAFRSAHSISPGEWREKWRN